MKITFSQILSGCLENAAIRFLRAKYEILQLYHSAIRFLQRNAKFRIVPKWPFVFFITKHKILKFVPKRPFIFQNELENFESCTQTANSYFLPGFYALVFYIFINNSRLTKLKKSQTLFCRHW